MCASASSHHHPHVNEELRSFVPTVQGLSLEDMDPTHIFNKCIYGIFLAVRSSQTDTIMTATHNSCTVYSEQKQFTLGTQGIHQLLLHGLSLILSF